MGEQLKQAYNQGAMQQGNDYSTTLGDYFNQTTPTSPYWGTYTEPLNINPTQTAAATTIKKGRNGEMVAVPVKSKSSSSFNNPSPLPNYSMYLAPDQMPDVNAYLYSPNSLLGAIQSAGIPVSGAGRFANLLSTNTSTGNK